MCKWQLLIRSQFSSSHLSSAKQRDPIMDNPSSAIAIYFTLYFRPQSATPTGMKWSGGIRLWEPFEIVSTFNLTVLSRWVTGDNFQTAVFLRPSIYVVWLSVFVLSMLYTPLDTLISCLVRCNVFLCQSLHCHHYNFISPRQQLDFSNWSICTLSRFCTSLDVRCIHVWVHTWTLHFVNTLQFYCHY